MQPWIQIVTGAIGTLGFALVSHVRAKLLPPAVAGGLLAWAIYLGSYGLTANLFLGNLIAAMAVYVWSEGMARRMKAPVTTFLLPGIIPLLPGSYLYYTTLALLNRDTDAFQRQAGNTVAITMGIACGVVIASILATYVIQTLEHLRERRGKRRP